MSMHFKIYRYSYEISNVTLILQKRLKLKLLAKTSMAKTCTRDKKKKRKKLIFHANSEIRSDLQVIF